MLQQVPPPSRAFDRLVSTFLWTSILLLTARSAFAGLAVDTVVPADRSSSSTSITSPAFSTKSGNELLLAFIATDAKKSGMTVTTVTGAGVNWALVQRTNAQLGTSEVWSAFAPSALSAVTVKATLAQSVAASMTIVTFTGVDTTGINGSGAIGVRLGNSASTGAPSTSLVTTRNGSWVFGVGNDYDSAIPRTPAQGQSVIHSYLATVGDTYWVQEQNTPTASSGTQVFISDTAPTTDRWNLSLVEVLPALGTGATYTATGSITPPSAGSQTTVALSGTSSGTTTADSNGNYSFPNLVNGTYSVTPSKTGFAFTPAVQPFSVNGANVTIPTITGTQVWSISGSITPASAGGGTVMMLSGPSTGTANVVSGNYIFPNLQNGSYTVTPTNSSFTFTPQSLPVTINGNSVTG